MEDANRAALFVQRLTEHQNQLYGYVFSLIGDRSRAADILQETNLVLWRKMDEYEPERPFIPWAFAIARFQVLAHLRDQQRDRLLLDATLVELISDESQQQAAQLDTVRGALAHCLRFLSATHRELIERRYFREMSIQDVAAAVDRTASSTKVTLLRIRRQLADCIQERLATD